MQDYFLKRCIKVLIVDDLPRVREGLSIVLELAGNLDEPHIEVVGKACNGKEAVEMVDTLHPEVVLIDLEMPVLDGFAAASQIKLASPRIKIIILTIHADAASRLKARSSGVDVFIQKGAPVEDIIKAIRGEDCDGSTRCFGSMY